MMNNYLPTDFQQYIHLSRYSRWLPEKNRRETWEETVERYFNFFQQHLAENHNHDITPYRSELQNAVLSLEVMPSMRAMMTAGEALRREPMSGFNCSYLAVDNPRSFDEILYVLMNGTGAGFSVETKYVDQLPSIAESFHESETVIVVSDSKLGWAKALRELIGLLYLGQIPRWDVSRVRPAGSPLKTFGGRASGPGPLVDLFQFCVNTFKKAAGRKLTQLEAHDIVCKIAEIVVVGGVRRCLPGDARIQSENGYVYMKDITVGDKIITGGKPYRVLEKVASGKQKIINIQHQFGVLRCTENHEVAVFNSMKEYIFKKASDIKLDDALVWDTFGTPGRIGVDIPKYNTTQNSRCKTVTFPEKVTTDLAWIVGLVHGDGYVSDRCVSITTNNTDIQLLDEANCIMETVFGISGTKKPYSKSDCTDIRFYSKELAGWFRENIKTPKNPIRIPEWIFGADSSTRYAYLAGLFDSDGRITTDGGIDQVTTVYESLKSDVVTLLATLGIGSKIIHKVNNRRRDNGVNAQDFYTIRIIGQTNRNAWTNVQHYCQSNKIGKLLTSKVTGYDFSFPITIHGVTQTHRNRNMSTIAALSKGLIDNMNYLPTRVIGIEYGPEEETYDIEVEDVHQFTVDGLVVHNSALISLSDLSDDRMRQAKSGQWWVDHVQRALANNSAVYNEKPDIGIFMDEWKALYESRSGERGIFNRQAGKRHMEKFGRRDSKPDHGVNPCGEILLRNGQVCNLSEAVIRATDSEEDISRKIRLATILGTWQSTLTNFKYLSRKWRDNSEEERLLGVSMTGITDSTLTNGKVAGLPERLDRWRELAVATNREFADKLGINPSVAVTCVKPSGTVSSLVNSGSGIHSRHSPYYIRSVRADKKDPLAKMMVDMGFPVEDDVTKPDHNYVFFFPIKSPENAIFRDDVTATEQLELWLTYKKHFTEHNPSVTITIQEHEWLEVGAWTYKNFDNMTGVSFLPASDTVYKQMPYQTCTKEEYEELLHKMPKNVDWSKLSEYELNDMTIGSQELACVAGGCEI